MMKFSTEEAEGLRLLRRAAKAAAKTAGKKQRRAQRSLEDRGPDDPGTRALVAAAQTASEEAERRRKEVEEAERISRKESFGDGSGYFRGEGLEEAADAAKESSPSEKKGQRFSCVNPHTGSDIAEGLVLHRDVITPEEERELISFIDEQCDRGRRGELRKPTYLRASGERSRGNNREAIMYGGFFDFNRARPGRRDLVPSFPPILQRLVRRLVDELGVLPLETRPDSVIINRYSAGDCIPPHVDHPSYHRPISTLSLLGEEPMLIGSKFRTVRACKWATVVGMSVPCPRRSLLVLGGNSGNIAKHCISACSGPRISITLRKQPPPDWKPDVSELVTDGKSWGDRKRQSIGDAEERGANTVLRKSKPLSGSAKRRKKMAKLHAKK